MAGLTRIHRAATSALWQAIASSKVIFPSQVAACPKAISQLQAASRTDTSAQSQSTARTETASRLLDNYGNHILRLAYTYVHNLSDAEDILQDTLVQYLKTTPVFENAAHEKAWLLRTAANLSKNRIKYNRLRTTDELNEELIAEEREDPVLRLGSCFPAAGGPTGNHPSVLSGGIFRRTDRRHRGPQGKHRPFRPDPAPVSA